MRLAVTVAFAMALWLGDSAAAHAEDPSRPAVETVQLEYRVPQGCPDERAFVDGVHARTERARFTAEPSAGRRFSIDVRRSNDRFVGTLVIVQGEESARREITSARCSDVVGAFIFFVSIAMDPARGSDGRPDAPEAPPNALEPPRPAEDSRTPRRGDTETPPGVRPAPRHPAQPRPPSRAAQDRKPPPSSFHLSLGSGAMAATGIAEPMMASVHPVVDLASDATWPSPSVRVGVLWSSSRSQAVPPAGRLTVGLRALTLSGCALRVPLGSMSASVRLCAHAEGGVLLVRPFAIERPTAPVRPWFAVGPMLRAEVELVPKRLSVGVDAAIVVPLEREQVHRRSGPTVELVQSAGVRLGAVVLVRAF